MTLATGKMEFELTAIECNQLAFLADTVVSDGGAAEAFLLKILGTGPSGPLFRFPSGILSPALRAVVEALAEAVKQDHNTLIKGDTYAFPRITDALLAGNPAHRAAGEALSGALRQQGR